MREEFAKQWADLHAKGEAEHERLRSRLGDLSEAHDAAQEQRMAEWQQLRDETDALVRENERAEDDAAERDAHEEPERRLGSGVVAQVKMEGVKTTRHMVQALYGVASLEDKRPVFFSLAGYTRQAIDWAESAGVACFEFTFDGGVEARTGHARDLRPTNPLRTIDDVEGWQAVDDPVRLDRDGHDPGE
jgi:hypothetical protein